MITESKGKSIRETKKEFEKGERAMRANYFRYLYENTSKGTVYTMSIAGEQGDFCGYYVCGYGEPVFGEKMDERFAVCSQEVSLLVLENLCDGDRDKIAEFAEKNQVDKVVMPYGETPIEFGENVKQVIVLEEGQSLSYLENGRRVWLKCFANGKHGTIVMYCDARIQEAKDCQMTVWAFQEETKVSVCVDKDDHSCAMRNCLYNDFDVCKGHNGKGYEEYVTGTLLLGNVNLKECREQLLQDLGEFLGEIRFVVLPGGGKKELYHPWVADLLEQEHRGLNHYYIVPREAAENDGTISSLMKKGIRHRVVVTGEECGLCTTGFFVEKSEE